MNGEMSTAATLGQPEFDAALADFDQAYANLVAKWRWLCGERRPAPKANLDDVTMMSCYFSSFVYQHKRAREFVDKFIELYKGKV